MGNFVDYFARTNYPRLGNRWLLQHQHEGAVPPVDAWRIANHVAYPKAANQTIAYQPSLYVGGKPVRIQWTVTATSAGLADSLLVFHHDARPGSGRSGLYIRISGTTGQLTHRRQLFRDLVMHETVLGSWTRTAGANYTITVEVSAARLVSVYDTGAPQPGGTECLERTITLTDDASVGVGMLLGPVNTVRLTDLSVTKTATFDVDDVTAHVTANLHLDLVDPDPHPGFPEAFVNHAGVSVGPYVMVDGVPTRVFRFATRPTLVTTGALTKNDTGVAPDPLDISVGSNVRWLAKDLTRANDRWVPTIGTGSGLYWSFTDTQDPEYDPDFVYTSARGVQSGKALVFHGGSSSYSSDYMKLAGTLPAAGAPWTLSMCAVFFAGYEKHYQIFSTDPNNGSTRPNIGVYYQHGLIYLEIGSRIISHETVRNAPRPTIVTLTVDPVKNTGLLLIQDSRRTTHTFSTKTADDSARLKIGCFALTSPEPKPHAQMHLFEVNYWNRTISTSEILRHNTELSHIYGVVR